MTEEELKHYLDFRKRRIVHEKGYDRIIYGSKGTELPDSYKADDCLFGDQRHSSVPSNPLSLQGLIL